MLDEHALTKLVIWLQSQGVAASGLSHARKLSGGAIQENWALDLALENSHGTQIVPLVLRADAPSSVGESLGRAQEFNLLRAAFSAGVTVPEPLWLNEGSLLGRPFFIMRRAAGTAAGHRIVKDPSLGGDKIALTRRIGEEFARLHKIRPPASTLAASPTQAPNLDFLTLPRTTPVQDAIRDWRHWLDQHHTPFPALEWGLRWLELHEPTSLGIVLCHRDLRTGNYMVDEHGLTAILDWEFAGWSDPREDLGWFCARCWRFGQTGPGKEAGGIGPKEVLLASYQAVSGIDISPADLHYWEVYAHARWAMIALMQGERHNSGQERSLELALTAHIVPELELQILRMTLAYPDASPTHKEPR
ncbi:predicted aminoglycoside phosphotransferase [gamma proteobacterium HdN1]|nr:predicted aminoglycoside phosphotransferase [gamma proteobacterium HdN1]